MKMSVGDSDLKIGGEREFMLSLKLRVDKSHASCTVRAMQVTVPVRFLYRIDKTKKIRSKGCRHFKYDLEWRRFRKAEQPVGSYEHFWSVKVVVSLFQTSLCSRPRTN